MFKKLLGIYILCFWLVLLIAYRVSWSGMVVGSGVAASGVACTVDNDGVVSDSGYDTDAGTSLGAKWVCGKHTISAGAQITGVLMGMCDNAQAGNMVISVVAHDATYDEPDMDGSVIITKSFGNADVTDCGTRNDWQTFIFDATSSAVGTTTVWVCSQEDGFTALVAFDTSEAGGRRCYATSAGTPVNNTNWTCNADDSLQTQILGCE